MLFNRLSDEPPGCRADVRDVPSNAHQHSRSMFSGTAFSPPIVGAMRRIVAHVAPAPGRRYDPTISPYASCCSTARPFPSG